jgi:hypothetical protein
MKKKVKKLELAKETVRSLESDDVRQVAGGTLRDTACYGCFSADYSACCDTRNTCGTRLC